MCCCIKRNYECELGHSKKKPHVLHWAGFDYRDKVCNKMKAVSGEKNWNSREEEYLTSYTWNLTPKATGMVPLRLLLYFWSKCSFPLHHWRIQWGNKITKVDQDKNLNFKEPCKVWEGSECVGHKEGGVPGNTNSIGICTTSFDKFTVIGWELALKRD